MGLDLGECNGHGFGSGFGNDLGEGDGAGCDEILWTDPYLGCGKVSACDFASGNGSVLVYGFDE